MKSRQPSFREPVIDFFSYVCSHPLCSRCPATWKTWKCQGISMQGKKSEKVREFSKTRKVRELCCVKSISRQSEHPNFETFLQEHAPTPLNSFGQT